MIRKILIGLVVAVVALVGLGAVAKAMADARYLDGYQADLPLKPEELERGVIDEEAEIFGIARHREFERIRFTFQSRPGDHVPALLTFPKDGEREQYPAIIFLHGIGQKKEFLEAITTPFNRAGFAMACFDQYMQGERDVTGGILKQAAAFRQRPARTINDCRRFVDYLEQHPRIDPRRIYLIGASYGAITGTTVVSLEKRINAAVLVVGGANVPVMLDAPVIREEVPPWLHAVGKPILSYIMAPADPMRYAANTAPTPVLFQNGDRDRLVTPEAGRQLHAAAGEPKEVRWYPCDHPGLKKDEGPIILRILDEAKEWLVEKDMPFRLLEEAEPAQANAA